MKLAQIEENTYTLSNHLMTSCLYNIEGNKYVITDPGYLNQKNYQEYIAFLKEKNIHPKYLICTHGHVDHANSVVYLKNEFGSKVIMPEYESYFFDNPKFYIHKVIRAKNLNYQKMYSADKLKVDLIVKEEEIIIENKKFNVERLAGHSFNHCGFSTPDNVIYLGDTLLSEDLIMKTKIPYIFDIDVDLKSKRKILNLNYDHYLVSHKGIIYDKEKVVNKNVDFINEFFVKIINYLKKPMTYEEITSKINKELKIGESVLKFLIAERSIKSFVYYLEKHSYIDSCVKNHKIYYKKIRNFENISL